jgi:hypothetical protein
MVGKPWADVHEAMLIEALKAGKSYAEAGELVGRSAAATAKKAQMLGVRSCAKSLGPKSQAKPWAPAEDRQIEAWIKEGVAVKEMARRLGRTYSTVHTRKTHIMDGLVRHLAEAPQPAWRPCIGALCMGKKFIPSHRYQFLCAGCKAHCDHVYEGAL